MLHSPVAGAIAVAMQAYQLITRQCCGYFIYMRQVVFDEDDVERTVIFKLLHILFHLLCLAIVHYYVDDCIDPFQQVTRYFPVAQVGAEQYTAFAILYQLLYMFHTFVGKAQFIAGTG